MESNNKPDILLIVPFTLPGCDKEKIAQIFQKLLNEQRFEYHIVSIKETKANLSQKLENNVEAVPKQDKFDFKVVQRFAKKKFYDELKSVMRTIVKKSWLFPKSSAKPIVIFLNKNHPPNSWERLESFVKEQKDLSIKQIGLCVDHDKLNRLNLNGDKYPFDEATVLNCFTRVLDRKLPYETIAGTSEEKLCVVGTFLGKFREFIFSTKTQFDHILQVSVFDIEKSNARLNNFSNEEEEIKKKLFDKVASAIKEQSELIGELKDKGLGVAMASEKGEDTPWKKVQKDVYELFSRLKWEYSVLPDEKIADSLNLSIKPLIEKFES